MSFTDLPVELVPKVLSKTDHRRDLPSLQLVCKSFNDIITPILWTRLNIEQGRVEKKRDLTRLISFCKRITSDKNTRNVLQYVRILYLTIYEPDWRSLEEITPEDMALLRKAMPNMSRLDIRCYCFNSTIDRIVLELPGDQMTIRINKARPIVKKSEQLIPSSATSKSSSSSESSALSSESTSTTTLSSTVVTKTPILMPNRLKKLAIFMANTDILTESSRENVQDSLEEFAITFRESSVENVDGQIMDILIGKSKQLKKLAVSAKNLTNPDYINWIPKSVEVFSFSGHSIDYFVAPNLVSARLDLRKVPIQAISMPALQTVSYNVDQEPTRGEIICVNQLSSEYVPVLKAIHLHCPPTLMKLLLPQLTSSARNLTLCTTVISGEDLKSIVEYLRQSSVNLEQLIIDSFLANCEQDQLADILCRAVAYNSNLTKLKLSNLGVTQLHQDKLVEGFNELKEVSNYASDGLSRHWELSITEFTATNKTLINKYQQVQSP